MRPRRRLLLLLLPIAIAAVLWWLLAGFGDWQRRPAQRSGHVWAAPNAATPCLLFVTREERERRLRVSRNFFRSESYDRYVLHVHRIADGARLQSMLLADLTERQEPLEPQILGIVDGHVWLWRNGPTALTLPDLRPAFARAQLEQQAPDQAELLPREPKGYAIRSEPLSLVLRGRDARLYALDAVNGALTPFPPEQLPATTFSSLVEDRFLYLMPPGRSRVLTSPSDAMEQSFLTGTGRYYGLLTDGDRADIDKYLPKGRPHGEVARRLYGADYRLDGSTPQLDLATVAALGDERLLQSGFLVRRHGTLWDVPDPSSTLVLARQRLGADEPWRLVRLGRDGRALWSASTGLADLGELLDLGTHVLFVGYLDSLGRGAIREQDRRERLVWIDERSGAVQTLVVEDAAPSTQPAAAR
ncbi:MAG: hypothetical protein MUC36_08510 [Planctomycetes bacterium]|nr:hypothetical protein [Planctomycetota bacterium]